MALWGFDAIQWAPRKREWWENLAPAISQAATSAASSFATNEKAKLAAQQAKYAQELELRKLAATEAQNAEENRLASDRIRNDRANAIMNADVQRLRLEAANEKERYDRRIDAGKMYSEPMTNELHALDPVRGRSQMAPVVTAYSNAEGFYKQNPGSGYPVSPAERAKMAADIQGALSDVNASKLVFADDGSNYSAEFNAKDYANAMAPVKEARLAQVKDEDKQIKRMSAHASIPFEAKASFNNYMKNRTELIRLTGITDRNILNQYLATNDPALTRHLDGQRRQQAANIAAAMRQDREIYYRKGGDAGLLDDSVWQGSNADGHWDKTKASTYSTQERITIPQALANLRDKYKNDPQRDVKVAAEMNEMEAAGLLLAQ